MDYAIRKFLLRFTVWASILFSLFFMFVYTNLPIIKDVRALYIETAMSTGDHQWLATSLFPDYIISQVTNQKDEGFIGVTSTDVYTIAEVSQPATPVLNSAAETNTLQQDNLAVDALDYAGNKILVNDKDQKIVISELSGQGYYGKIALIDKPERVHICTTKYKENKGEFITEFLNRQKAVLGMNASGFSDINGNGTGGKIMGRTISDGEGWGWYNDEQVTIGFNDKNQLIAGYIPNWENERLRDAFQFAPILIANGQKQVEGSAGWGIQPRSIIAQRADGVVIFMVIDGRQSHSIGITVGQCADILLSYNAVTAAACDGGSSSVLAYNGEIINKPSTPLKNTGRYLPNALIVDRI